KDSESSNRPFGGGVTGTAAIRGDWNACLRLALPFWGFATPIDAPLLECNNKTPSPAAYGACSSSDDEVDEELGDRAPPCSAGCGNFGPCPLCPCTGFTSCHRAVRRASSCIGPPGSLTTVAADGVFSGDGSAC